MMKLKLNYLQLSFAQFCLAINIILGKMLSVHYPVFCLLSLRFIISFVAILLFWGCTHQSKKLLVEIKSLQPKQWTLLTLQALFGGFLFNVLTLYGLQTASASAAGMIGSTVPIFVALFSFFILKEPISRAKLFSILFSSIGILFLSIQKFSMPPGSNELSGLLFLFLAIIPGALFTILAKQSSPIHPLIATGFLNLLNSLIFLPLTDVQAWHLFLNARFTEVLQLLAYAISGSFLFFVFWYKGLKNTPANTSALFVGIMPISTSLLAIGFLSESFSLFDLLGMSLILLSLYIGAL